MRPSHTRHRKDGNHAAIKEALEAVGATVHESDFCDLVVGFRERTYLIEAKSKGGKLTPFQQVMLKTWRGHYTVVFSVDEALDVIGAVNARMP